MIVADEYVELLTRHRPELPQTAAEHARLVELLESIELSGRVLSSDELRFTATLKALVTHYEDRVCPMREVPALEMLLHLVEEQGLRQVDFVPVLGSRSYVSQIFTGRRAITRGVAEKLASVLHVSVETFHT